MNTTSGDNISVIVLLQNKLDSGVRMDKYLFSKAIGVTLGILMILVVFGFSFLYILGTSLGRALNSGIDTTNTDQQYLIVLMSLFLMAIITAAGSFGLNRNAWRIFYIGFCLIIGLCLLIAFFYSLGALGTNFEIMLLFVSLIYFLLGLLVKKRM
jgi:hypothetical protein